MGSPSYTEGYDLELREGVTLDDLDKWLDHHSSDYSHHIDVSGKDIEVDFDDVKIIQYWYDEFLDFLDELATKVDGYIELSCPEYREYAEIVFEEGEVTIKLPSGKTEDYSTDELRKEKVQNE